MIVDGLEEGNATNAEPLQWAERIQILIFITSLCPPVETSCF